MRSKIKYRYIVKTFVDAGSPQEAIKIAKQTNPHDVFIDNEVWKMDDFAIKPNSKKLGYRENEKTK